MSEQKKVHPLQRAWAAGLFEGRVSWPRSGAAIRIESVNEALMKRFASIIPYGELVERDHKQCSRPVWMWRCQKMDDSRDALLFLTPFLTGDGVKKAADIIARVERNVNWRKKNPEKVTSSVINSPANSADHTTT